MSRLRITFLAILPIFFFGSCKQSPSNNDKKDKPEAVKSEPILSDSIVDSVINEEEDLFVLTEENAIDFFFDYQKNLKTTQVKLTTSLGSFVVELYDNVPYHKANFIYLTKKGYFDNTMFHRVVKDFIIQGGNADNKETANKRKAIGRYLLPPDTRKGYKHHRGTISMPSSEIDNPHMLASPYEFFIVVTKPGSYHLDGDFTPFGKVISGMDVVDNINQQPVDSGDWPMKNIYILRAEIVE